MLFVTFGGGLSAVRDLCTFSLALLRLRFHLSFALSAAAQTQQPRQLDDKLRIGSMSIYTYIFFFVFFFFFTFLQMFLHSSLARPLIASLLLRHLYALVHLQDSHYILLPKRQLDSRSRYACSICRNRGAGKNDASSDASEERLGETTFLLKVFALTGTNISGSSNLSDFQKTRHANAKSVFRVSRDVSYAFCCVDNGVDYFSAEYLITHRSSS